MAISSLDDLAVAMKQSTSVPLSKASLTAATGHEASLWRGTGYPTQGAIPTSAAVCGDSTVGAIGLIPTGAGEDRVILGLGAQMQALGHVLMVEDRLAHMGGLVGNVTTPQTVGIDLEASLGTSNLAERIGLANYSDVNWYLEWYTATGATVSTPTAQVTYDDDTTGSVNIWVFTGATALPASVAASRRYRIVPTNGKFIKSIETVTLSASTGTAGNFGVTAVRPLAKHECTGATTMQVRDWSYLNLPRVSDNACLTFGQLSITTTTGSLYGSLTQGKA